MDSSIKKDISGREEFYNTADVPEVLSGFSLFVEFIEADVYKHLKRESYE